jgi:hypothetical protein
MAMMDGAYDTHASRIRKQALALLACVDDGGGDMRMISCEITQAGKRAFWWFGGV